MLYLSIIADNASQSTPDPNKEYEELAKKYIQDYLKHTNTVIEDHLSSGDVKPTNIRFYVYRYGSFLFIKYLPAYLLLYSVIKSTHY